MCLGPSDAPTKTKKEGCGCGPAETDCSDVCLSPSKKCVFSGVGLPLTDACGCGNDDLSSTKAPALEHSIFWVHARVEDKSAFDDMTASELRVIKVSTLRQIQKLGGYSSQDIDNSKSMVVKFSGRRLSRTNSFVMVTIKIVFQTILSYKAYLALETTLSSAISSGRFTICKTGCAGLSATVIGINERRGSETTSMPDRGSETTSMPDLDSTTISTKDVDTARSTTAVYTNSDDGSSNQSKDDDDNTAIIAIVVVICVLVIGAVIICSAVVLNRKSEPIPDPAGTGSFTNPSYESARGTLVNDTTYDTIDEMPPGQRDIEC